ASSRCCDDVVARKTGSYSALFHARFQSFLSVAAFRFWLPFSAALGRDVQWFARGDDAHLEHVLDGADRPQEVAEQLDELLNRELDDAEVVVAENRHP